MRAEGVTAFKVKAGDAPERDEQRVAAVREAAGPDARITVDVNQGWWDARTAVRGIKLLEPYDIAFVEQPVRMDDLEAARFVRERVNVPIALDESVRGPREALACVKAGACDVFVIKLMKTGGILNALKVNAIAEAAGIPVTMGNMGESSLGLAAHLHVSIALANVDHWDADLPWRPGGLKRDIGQRAHRRGARRRLDDAGARGSGPRHRARRGGHRGAARDAALVTGTAARRARLCVSAGTLTPEPSGGSATCARG